MAAHPAHFRGDPSYENRRRRARGTMMDGQRFDALARRLATGPTRRGLFKGALVAVAGTVLPFGWTRIARADLTCGASCDDFRECRGSDDGCTECCNGVCVDTLSDIYNCFACDIVCTGAPDALC